MPYKKLEVLERFNEATNGFKVKEYTGDTETINFKPYYQTNSYKQIEKLFRRYWLQYLLSRKKEGTAYRYFITERGKSRLKYLKGEVEKDKSPA